MNKQIDSCDDVSLRKAIDEAFFATCQLVLDFSDRIVRHNNLSVHVQGLDSPCQCSMIEIVLTDDQ